MGKILDTSKITQKYFYAPKNAESGMGSPPSCQKCRNRINYHLRATILLRHALKFSTAGYIQNTGFSQSRTTRCVGTRPTIRVRHLLRKCQRRTTHRRNAEGGTRTENFDEYPDRELMWTGIGKSRHCRCQSIAYTDEGAFAVWGRKYRHQFFGIARRKLFCVKHLCV